MSPGLENDEYKIPIMKLKAGNATVQGLNILLNLSSEHYPPLVNLINLLQK
jgi:hypothetical protein